jgi:excisionase family DNA binding protein
MAEKLLTIRDVAQILGVTEKEVIDLSEQGAIPAYKVGGIYLRFKRDQIDEFRKTYKPSHDQAAAAMESSQDRFSDFVYFNDFYILSGLIIVILLVVIFRGY